jgi:hypothetical protein
MSFPKRMIIAIKRLLEHFSDNDFYNAMKNRNI